MNYAIELGVQQTARTIEQALRYQSPLQIEPRTWEDAGTLDGRLTGANNESLFAECEVAPDLAPESLVGTYCDVALHLGQDRFIFSTHVTGTQRNGDKTWIELARPARINVCQRRRLWRTRLAKSSDVRVQWHLAGVSHTAIGRLCNISGDGLACLVDAPVAASLSVGEPVSVQFALPQNPDIFSLRATLRAKSPGADDRRVMLGIQFDEPASTCPGGAAHGLQAYLVAYYGGQDDIDDLTPVQKETSS